MYELEYISECRPRPVPKPAEADRHGSGFILRSLSC